MSKKRIGIFGGTFDPVHTGHQIIASCALDSGNLDRLYVIPTGCPPYKTVYASGEDRWRMVSAAFSGNKRIVPSRVEIDRDGPTHAIDTVKALRREHPDDALFYIVGEDALVSIPRWYRATDLFPLCTFMVISREASVPSVSSADAVRHLTSLGARIVRLSAFPGNISSGMVREAFAAGGTPDGLDPAVLEYCACKGLYGAAPRFPRAGEWTDALFGALKPHRFAHSLSVALTSVRLAVRYGEDPVLAEEAGLLHDCAKNLPLEEMQSIAREMSLTDDPDMLSAPSLLHSVAGAGVARARYGMEDPRVLEAIAYHNTGYPGMSRLAMCVCLADYIEPRRDSFPQLEAVRAESERSLEKALLMSLEVTADYVISRNQYLHPRTRDTIRWLKTLPACSENN